MELWKKMFIVTAVTVVGYLVVILVAPLFINLNKDAIQTMVYDTSRLKVDYTTASPYVTPLLGVGAKFKDFTVKYADDRKFADSKQAIFEIDFPNLLQKRNIKFNKIIFKSINADTLILQSGQSNTQFYLHDNSHFTQNLSVKDALEKYTVTLSDVKLIDYKIAKSHLVSKVYQELKGKELVYTNSEVEKYLKDITADYVKYSN